MIEAMNTGLMACYPGSHPRPIVGWREGDGAAMITDRRTGRLAVAAEYVTPEGNTFSHVLPVENPIVTAVPGQGWSAQYHDAEGAVHKAPVIAFAIDSQGYPLPLIHDQDGSASPIDLSMSRGRLIPPAHE